MSEEARCGLCGEPMPPGEEMFKYHGYSGNCPKPPLPQQKKITSVSLGEINAQIHELEKKRAEIINKENHLNDENIKSLEWTKDCCAKLRINSLGSYGLPVYEIFVYGRKLPHTGKSGSVTISGNSSDCYDNLLYDSNVDRGRFSTSSERLLIQFLEQVQFQELEYPERFLNVLKAAEEASRRYEEK